MYFQQVWNTVAVLLITATDLAAACPSHQYKQRSVPVDTLRGPHVRRSDLAKLYRRAESGPRDWNYTASNSWASIKAEYATCGTGTQQSPISLFTASRSTAPAHQPIFTNYDRLVEGELSNWGFGPSYTIAHAEGNLSTLPTLQYDTKTVYLTGWHMHFAAEHLIDGTRTTAEMHLVHADAAGHPAAVIGIPVDVGAATASSFLPAGIFSVPGNNDTTVVPNVPLNMFQAIQGAGNLTNFWTYEGSLTTPPCTEGLRWFVSSEVLRMSQAQVDNLLKSNGGIYSARIPQLVQNQRVNQ